MNTQREYDAGFFTFQQQEWHADSDALYCFNTLITGDEIVYSECYNSL